jgi:predicted dehydrogenase
MPKDILNVAVIGTGAIGTNHIAGFQEHAAARVVAIADVAIERAREAADRFRVPEAVTDYRQLLARTDIDVVSIALPNYLHAPAALDALAAGKHVMLEKPMAMHAREAEALAAAAQTHGVLLMVGQNQRFTAEIQTAKQLVEDGLLGDVYHAKTAWCRRAGIPRIGSWFTQKKFAGGGCCYDIGAHGLDRCLYLLGEFDAVAVSGQTFGRLGALGQGDGTWGRGEIDPAKPFDVEDLAVALIKLRSGRSVLLEVSWAAHQALADYDLTQLFGTKAGLTLSPVQLHTATARGYATEVIKPLPPKVSTNRMVHFIDCVLGKAEPYVRVEESLAVQRILDAIYESASTGREVRLDRA